MMPAFPIHGIHALLDRIKRERGVRIIHACESGSRAEALHRSLRAAFSGRNNF